MEILGQFVHIVRLPFHELPLISRNGIQAARIKRYTPEIQILVLELQ